MVLLQSNMWAECTSNSHADMARRNHFPDKAARQLPDLSTTIRLGPSVPGAHIDPKVAAHKGRCTVAQSRDPIIEFWVARDLKP